MWHALVQSMSDLFPADTFSRLRVTFLGTGTSTGVPVIGCDCAVCRSTDPRNQRFRSSLWVQTERASVLVDAGPDLRMQALRAKIKNVDAVLYTHGHMDHVVGFDELRAYCWNRDTPLPMYANQGCMDQLRTMFAWAFADTNIYRGYIKPGPVVFDGSFLLEGIQVTPLPVLHGNVETHGFLFRKEGHRSLAYISDVKRVSREAMDAIHGCDVLVIDALHHRSHPTHMNVTEALEVIEQAQPQLAYFTHCSHEIDHAQLEKTLPASVRIAYDTLTIDL